MKQDNQTEILGIALVICKNPLTGKYLAVHEVNNTWWVPGGRVDAPQYFSQGAIRECKEEAGIDINLKGILRIQQSPGQTFQRLKIVYYAEPKDPHQKPKQFKDKESLEAKYMSLQQIQAIKSKWRGPELYHWSLYLEKGGIIYDLDLLQEQSGQKQK